MPEFDPHSFLVLTGLLGVLCLVVLAVVIRNNFPKSIGGVSEWSWACGLMVVAAFLYSSTRFFPAGVARIIANSLVTFGFLMMYIGLRQFGGFAPKHRMLAYFVGASSLLMAWFTLVDNNYKLRITVAMLAHLVMFVACASVILRLKHNSFPERFTLGIFLLLTVVSVARLYAVAVGLDQIAFIDGPDPFQTVYIAIITFSIIALTVGFMLIVSRRLRDTLGYLTTNSAFAKHRHDARLELERELRMLIQKNQLVLHYQPRIHVKTGVVSGMEALLRWKHPTKGLIGPDQFIQACEETGAILAIGEWVLDQAVHVLSHLHAEVQPGIHMSVNVSPKQFNSGALSAQIERLLKNANFAPHQLELELTESVLIEDPTKAEKIMAQLKRMGVRLSVDDFGTGYSSLSYLKRLPVDCVKIDRSFVVDLPGDSGDVAITRAIIAMAHALELQVVAEGVEKPDQLAFLLENGCDEYQGHLFSAALSEEEICQLLEKAMKKNRKVIPGFFPSRL